MPGMVKEAGLGDSNGVHVRPRGLIFFQQKLCVWYRSLTSLALYEVCMVCHQNVSSVTMSAECIFCLQNE